MHIIYILYFILCFLNYCFSQSDFSVITTYTEIILGISLALPILLKLFTYKKKISSDILIFLVLFLLAIITILINKNKYENFLSIISLINQLFIFYYYTFAVLHDFKHKHIIKIIYDFIFYTIIIFSFLNLSIIILHKFNIIQINSITLTLDNYRYSGFMVTPAFLSSLSVSLVFVCYYKFKNNYLRVISIIVAFMFFYFSQSRSGLFAMIMFLFMYYLLNAKNKFLYLLIFTSSFFLVFVVFGDRINEIFFKSRMTNDISSGRISLWINAISNFSLRDIFGIGPRNIHLLEGMQDFSGGYHNAYIQLIKTNGILFSLIIYLFIFYYILLQIKKRQYFKNDTYLINLSFCIAFLCYNLFESHLFFLRFHNIIIFWFALGINKYLIFEINENNCYKNT